MYAAAAPAQVQSDAVNNSQFLNRILSTASSIYQNLSSQKFSEPLKASLLL